MAKKKSFFERLAGGINMEETARERELTIERDEDESDGEWVPEEEAGEEGQLAVDVYQTADEIIIEAMIAGVRPEDLNVAITRDMVTIKGKRQDTNEVTEENYFYKELYWGSFSRTILLPHEIDIEGAEAAEKHGLLVMRLPKIDKGRQAKLRVKSI
ncbi:Hsp20/alpha crystallin family protein [Candidatus Parcubacteria bacterium]|nr:Hsp20/alpha crystallin family protein [Candidatus Parcubacteria bacterium]